MPSTLNLRRARAPPAVSWVRVLLLLHSSNQAPELSQTSCQPTACLRRLLGSVQLMPVLLLAATAAHDGGRSRQLLHCCRGRILPYGWSKRRSGMQEEQLCMHAVGLFGRKWCNL